MLRIFFSSSITILSIFKPLFAIARLASLLEDKILFCAKKSKTFIPFLISLHWIIFNGCIIDKFHHKNCNINTIPTNNITPFLELFNKEFASYIHDNYLKNTMRPSYIFISKDFLILTIIIVFNDEIRSYY